ncbi:MAG: hypothetical protein GY696_16630, partial [Gammaproteobacteria bacterium]|nr:hypothetical protein [Gammaproteobacteria bacterium]
MAKGRRGVIQLASPRRKEMSFKDRESEVASSEQRSDTADEIISAPDQHLEEESRTGSFFPSTVDLHGAAMPPTEINSDDQIDTATSQDNVMMRGRRGIMQIAPPRKRGTHQNEAEEEYLAKGRRGIKQLASPRRKVMSRNGREEEGVGLEHYDNVMCAQMLPEDNLVFDNTSLGANELHDVAEPPILLNKDAIMKGRRGVEQAAFPRKKNLYWHASEDDIADYDIANEIVSEPSLHFDKEEELREQSFFPSTVDFHEASVTPTNTDSSYQVDSTTSQDEALMKGHRGVMQVASPLKRHAYQSEIEEEDLAKGRRGVKQLASPHKKTMSLTGREGEVMSSQHPENTTSEVNRAPDGNLDQAGDSSAQSFSPCTVNLHGARSTPTKTSSSVQVDNAISQDEALMKGHRGVKQVASPLKRHAYQSEMEEEDLAKGRRGVKQLASPHKTPMSLIDREGEVMSSQHPEGPTSE